MAADLFLAELASQCGEPILRLYTWEKPTLSLGYHQRISEATLEICRKWDIMVVRRPTGGRAVLHDRELTYSLSIPADSPLLKMGRSWLLREIGTIFVIAAAKIGVKAELVRAGRPDGERGQSLRKGSPLCFHSLSRWEVRRAGRKWIGSAQRLLADSFLQHGSILLGVSSIDPIKLFDSKVSAGTARYKEARELKMEIREFNSTVKGGLGESALRRAIPAAFSDRWNLCWRRQNFTAEEVAEIARNIDIPDVRKAYHKRKPPAPIIQ